MRADASVMNANAARAAEAPVARVAAAKTAMAGEMVKRALNKAWSRCA